MLAPRLEGAVTDPLRKREGQLEHLARRHVLGGEVVPDPHAPQDARLAVLVAELAVQAKGFVEQRGGEPRPGFVSFRVARRGGQGVGERQVVQRVRDLAAVAQLTPGRERLRCA